MVFGKTIPTKLWRNCDWCYSGYSIQEALHVWALCSPPQTCHLPLHLATWATLRVVLPYLLSKQLQLVTSVLAASPAVQKLIEANKLLVLKHSNICIKYHTGQFYTTLILDIRQLPMFCLPPKNNGVMFFSSHNNIPKEVGGSKQKFERKGQKEISGDLKHYADLANRR